MIFYHASLNICGVAVGLRLFLDGREGNKTLFDFFERDAGISTPHRIDVNSWKRAMQQLLRS